MWSNWILHISIQEPQHGSHTNDVGLTPHPQGSSVYKLGPKEDKVSASKVPAIDPLTPEPRPSTDYSSKTPSTRC